MKYTVGTRASRLAIAQTKIVLESLRRSELSVDFDTVDFDIVTVTTTGDMDKRPLFAIDQKGIFEKDLNEFVIRGNIDFAVHSLKDLPSDLADELTIACIPKRAKPNDVLVNDKKLKLTDLVRDSTIGTSSLRRAIQVIRKRPDLNVRPIRGNIETRVKKSISAEYDAVILAEAGLTRLGMKDVIVERFNIRDFVPAPGQGAIAIVCRKDNLQLIKILRSIQDSYSKAEIDAERALLRKIEGGCRFPVGAVATTAPNKQKIILYASIFSADGTKSIKLRETGSLNDPDRLGAKTGRLLLEEGASKLSAGWREAVAKWNKKL